MILINKTRHTIWWFFEGKFIKFKPLDPIRIPSKYERRTKTTTYSISGTKIPHKIPGIKYIVSSCVKYYFPDRDDFIILGNKDNTYYPNLDIILLSNFHPMPSTIFYEEKYRT